MEALKKYIDQKIKAPEADLNEECVKAANYYVGEKLKGYPIEVRSSALTHVAAGYFMAYRKFEEIGGFTNGELK